MLTSPAAVMITGITHSSGWMRSVPRADMQPPQFGAARSVITLRPPSRYPNSTTAMARFAVADFTADRVPSSYQWHGRRIAFKHQTQCDRPSPSFTQ